MQLDALKKTGCRRIFTDKLSGAQVDRPGLKEALAQLRAADTLVVWKLDRLGRSAKGLVDLVNELDDSVVRRSQLPLSPKPAPPQHVAGLTLHSLRLHRGEMLS